MKSIESDITLLDNRYQNGQIDENAYRAEFAALKARHETINQEINKKTSEIQEQQRQFQSKYSDKEVSEHNKRPKVCQNKRRTNKCRRSTENSR